MFSPLPQERWQDRKGLEEMSRLVKRLGEEDINNEDAAKDEAEQHPGDGDEEEDPLLHLEWGVSMVWRLSGGVLPAGPFLPGSEMRLREVSRSLSPLRSHSQLAIIVFMFLSMFVCKYFPGTYQIILIISGPKPSLERRHVEDWYRLMCHYWNNLFFVFAFISIVCLISFRWSNFQVNIFCVRCDEEEVISLRSDVNILQFSYLII